MMRRSRTREVAFKKVELKNTFGEYLAAYAMAQAESLRQRSNAHVTFFFSKNC